MLDKFAACWEGFEDPRTGNAALHGFHEVLMISLCAVPSGGQGAVDMALFARTKEPFLRGFLTLANGLPNHDTFSRLFRQLDPVRLGAVFQRFMAGFCQKLEGVVAIDGKVLPRSFDRASGKSPLHMVSAWGCEQRVALAQVVTDTKSNEITAVPKLLEDQDSTRLGNGPQKLAVLRHMALNVMQKDRSLARKIQARRLEGRLSCHVARPFSEMRLPWHQPRATRPSIG